jgi:hypothetical protein
LRASLENLLAQGTIFLLPSLEIVRGQGRKLLLAFLEIVRAQGHIICLHPWKLCVYTDLKFCERRW